MARPTDRDQYLHGRIERSDNGPLMPDGHPLGPMSGLGVEWNRADPLPEPPEGSVEALILKLRRTPVADTGLDPDAGWS